MPIMQEIPIKRREYRGRDSSHNILCQAVWAQREESTPRLIVCRVGRESGPVIGLHGNMGVRRIMRQLRTLVPQFEVTTGESPLIIAALIRGVIANKPVRSIDVVDELWPILYGVDLRILH